VLGITFLAASSSTSSTNPLSPLLLVGLLGVVFYFLLIRPQRRQQAQQRDLANNIDPGDEIVTHGGIYGTVTEVDDDEGTILLEVAPGIELRMLKGAVARRIESDAGGDADDNGSKDAKSSGKSQPALGDGATASGEKEADEQR
jgi:preprotein translocase subunit YajC